MNVKTQRFSRAELDRRGWHYSEPGWYVLWHGETEPVGPDSWGPFDSRDEAYRAIAEEYPPRYNEQGKEVAV